MDSPLPQPSASAATTPLASPIPPHHETPQQQSALPVSTREGGRPSSLSEPAQDPPQLGVKTEPSCLSLPPTSGTITVTNITISGPSSSTPDASHSHSHSHSPLPEPSKSANKPQRHCLTRDQRRDILLMRSLGHTYHQICNHLNLPFGAVQYTCQKRSASPKRRPGRARRLTDEKLDEIEAFVTSSIKNRQMTYQEVVNTLGLDVKEDTLTQAMRKRGLVRQMAFLKSPLAVGNITAKPIRTYLTCRRDEEIDSPLVVEVIKRKGA